MNKAHKAQDQDTLKDDDGGTPPKGPITVVPDANVLFGDPFVRGVAPRAIIAASNFADITGDEVRNIVKERLGKLVKELRKLTREADSLALKTGVNVWGLDHESKQALSTWDKQ